MLKPLSNNVLIEPKEKKSESGIIIPDTANRERPAIGKIVSIGPKVKSVKEGDNVLIKTYMVDEIEIDKKKYLIGQEDAVIGTIDA